MPSSPWAGRHCERRWKRLWPSISPFFLEEPVPGPVGSRKQT
jgi:hypothetical protein